jgi:hypothetical protein
LPTTPTKKAVDVCLDRFSFEMPSEGPPPVMDWQTCFYSFLWRGNDLRREPIDAQTPCKQEDTVSIIKGWTRLTCLAYIVMRASTLDPAQPENLELLTPFDGVLEGAWHIPTNFTSVADRAALNAEHLMLSYAGSERQRPSVLKLALRFEESVATRKKTMASNAMRSDMQVLDDLLAEYNNLKAVSGVKRWQLGESTVMAMRCLIFNTSDAVRVLLRNHLNWHKWESSAFTADLLKNKRLFLGSRPPKCGEPWDTLLVVTEVSQLLLVKRMLRCFERACKKARGPNPNAPTFGMTQPATFRCCSSVGMHVSAGAPCFTCEVPVVCRGPCARG